MHVRQATLKRCVILFHHKLSGITCADRKGNAKSALALIGTDTLAGDNCQLLISGADEQEAHQRLSQWLRDEFPHCDAPLAEVKSDELEPLPVSLTNLNPRPHRVQR